MSKTSWLRLRRADQPEEALAALQRAAAVTPQNEKLFLFVADACMVRQQYEVDSKCESWPLQSSASARLHYQREYFSHRSTNSIRPKKTSNCTGLRPSSEIGYLVRRASRVFGRDVSEAVRSAARRLKLLIKIQQSRRSAVPRLPDVGERPGAPPRQHHGHSGVVSAGARWVARSPGPARVERGGGRPPRQSPCRGRSARTTDVSRSGRATVARVSAPSH